MKFHEGLIYHIYNQGNNRNKIFYEDENYLFFIRKIRQHILSLSDLIFYCLMPNHFHFLLMPNKDACKPGLLVKPGSKFNERNNDVYQEKLSQSLGILLSSYSQAVNRRYNRSGSLFRAKTKVKDGWINEGITVDGKNKELFFRPENDYAIQCFHYIHENPVKANLVQYATDWPYSSARDYANLRNGTLCNLKLGREMLGM